jgi:hypothetical protein
MDGRAASQTITDKISFLLEHGWKIHVLSAITGSLDHRFPHQRLFAVGPSAFRFDIRHWCALQFGRDWRYYLITFSVSIALFPLIILERFFVGLSSQWSWTISATLCGLIWVKKYDINLIYTSGGAWSAHAAGYCLKRLTGIKWIAEIHDPLVERHSKQLSKLRNSYSRETLFRGFLEKSICQETATCWWFTEAALRHASRRNPSIKGRGFFVLPGAQEPDIRINYRPSEQLIIGHFGSLSESRSLSDTIDALAEFLSSFPSRRGYVKVHVFGGTLDKQSIKAIERNKLADSVVEHGRVEFDRTTGLSGRRRINMMMQACDYLLLLHGSDPSCSEYIPSKFYEYWWARRPVLALVHKNRQLERLVLSMSDQNRVYRAADERKAGITMLIDAWDRWQDGTIREFELRSSPISPRGAVAKINEEINRRIKHV